MNPLRPATRRGEDCEFAALPDALSDDPPTHLERQLLAVDLDICVCAYCLRTQGHRVELLRALRLGHEAGRASAPAGTDRKGPPAASPWWWWWWWWWWWRYPGR